MSLPLPLATADRAAALLASTYTRLEKTVPGPADQPPALLVVLPPAWVNRYQSLLYDAAGPRRYATLGITDTSQLAQISWPGPIVLHAHWFAGVFQRCTNDIQAAERLARLRDELLAFRARTGARFLWTAHNVFPHGNAHPSVFLELRQWLFETFDAVHVMQAAHVPVLEDAFARPAPYTFTVPHMTYDHCLPDCVSVAAARVHYGVAPEAFVFAYFGSIAPYKNLERMLEAFERVRDTARRPVRAIIGGVPSDAGTVQRLQARWGADPDVQLVMRTIPDHEVQYLHRAADVMVLPYGETLNSGAAFMAASFGKPFIMPSGLASDALDGLGLLRFDSDTPDGLETAMQSAMLGVYTSADPDARAAVAPARVSSLFFDHLDQMIGRTPMSDVCAPSTIEVTA